MVFNPAEVALIISIVFVGAVLQRISGTGMGLVLAPTLTLFLGAGPGVLLSNATTTVSGFLLMLAMWRDVGWRRVGLICTFAPLGAALGALVVKAMSAGWLQILVGSVVVIALGTTVLASALGRLPHVRAPWVTPAAGVVGALFNATAGVAAPVMVVHSRLVRWDQREFAASMQPVFMAMGALSVAVKLTISSTHVAPPRWWLMLAIVVTVVVGIGIGTLIARRINARSASRVAMTLAALGGLGALIRGLLQVF